MKEKYPTTECTLATTNGAIFWSIIWIVWKHPLSNLRIGVGGEHSLCVRWTAFSVHASHLCFVCSFFFFFLHATGGGSMWLGVYITHRYMLPPLVVNVRLKHTRDFVGSDLIWCVYVFFASSFGRPTLRTLNTTPLLQPHPHRPHGQLLRHSLLNSRSQSLMCFRNTSGRHARHSHVALFVSLIRWQSVQHISLGVQCFAKDTVHDALHDLAKLPSLTPVTTRFVKVFSGFCWWKRNSEQ